MTKNLAVALTLLVPVPLAAQKPNPTSYTSFQGETLQRYVTTGRKVAFAVADRDTDREVLQKALRAFDAAYEFYATTTGREPADRAPSPVKGRTLIAEVETTCGAGCGYLGTKGIEIVPSYLPTCSMSLAGRRPRSKLRIEAARRVR